MIVLLLPFCIYSFEMPSFSKFGIFIIGDYTNSQVKDIQSKFPNLLKEYCDGKEGIEKSNCNTVKNKFVNIYFSSTSQINDKLKTISKRVRSLYFLSDISISNTIDFNNLPRLMTVSMQRIPEMISNLINKAIGKTNSLSPQLTEMKFYNFSLIGSIKDKVSFLFVYNSNIKFVRSQCNCENLYLDMDSKLDDNSEKVISTNFISFHFALSYLYSNYNYRPFFDVTELSFQQYFVDNSKFKISYTKTALLIGKEGYSSDWNYNSVLDRYGHIFNLKSNDIENLDITIICDDKKLSYYHPLNITIGYIEQTYNALGYLYGEYRPESNTRF